MAWDISDYKLENLGPDLADPGIDWEAIARMIAEKEEAAKETAESETVEPLDPTPEEAKWSDIPELPDPKAFVDAGYILGIAQQLRALADQIESL
jgi:hypothetical protein